MNLKETKEDDQLNESKLRDEIKTALKQIQDLETLTELKQQQLLLLGLSKILNVKPDHIQKTISDLAVEINEEDTTWNITYEHNTDTYHHNNYVIHSDSETEDEPSTRQSSIIFGKNKKYYIKGGTGNFNIYRNSDGILRIINQDYGSDLDISEQNDLMNKYSDNTDVIEWFGLKIFLFIAERNWSDADFIKYLITYM